MQRQISYAERLQTYALCPVDRTIALGLDDCLLGGPSNNVGGKIFDRDKRLFSGIEELFTNTQHLMAVKPFSVKSHDMTTVGSEGYNLLGVGNAQVYQFSFNKWSSLQGVGDCSRMSQGVTQEQSLGSLFTLSLGGQVCQVFTGNTRLTAQLE